MFQQKVTFFNPLNFSSLESNETEVGNNQQNETNQDIKEVKTEKLIITDNNSEVIFLVSKPHNRDYPMLF